MSMFKRSRLIPLLLLFASLSAQAQTNMVGRVYHNPNLLAGKMKELSQKADKEFDALFQQYKDSGRKDNELGKKFVTHKRA